MINQILNIFGLRLVKNHYKKRPPKEFIKNFYYYLNQLKNNKKLNVIESFRYDVGEHPYSHGDVQSEFAASCLSGLNPPLEILDVGSYKTFVAGLISGHRISTVDVREREPIANENLIVCDAKKLNLPDNEFDAVISLCSIEHFGLGRYGDEIDLEADRKAIKEMIRVLKNKGYFIFTIPITRGEPTIFFNAGRAYNYYQIKKFCKGLRLIKEEFYDSKNNKPIIFREIKVEPTLDYTYFGCWQKI